MFEMITPGVGSIIGAGLNFIGGIEQRQAQENQMWQQQGFNAAEAEKSRAFSAHQAAVARDFNASEAAKSRQYSTDTLGWQQGFAHNEAEIARGFNRDEAEASRRFAETMSSTAYQRATDDMRKAGLNPILAYAQGGASTPASAQASGPAASAGGVGSAQASGPAAGSATASSGSLPHYQNLLSSAVEAAKHLPAVQNLLQENKNLKEEERRIASTSELQTAQKLRTHEEVKRVAQETATEAERTKVVAGEGRRQELDKEMFEGKWGQYMRQIGTMNRELAPLVTNAKSLFQMVRPGF